MKKLLMPLFALVLLGTSHLVMPDQAEARRGCCSHHGGVCGCGCCDGSSLSAKCSPYYPSCSAKPAAAKAPAARIQNHNCQTMVSGVKGTWVFAAPNLKSKILLKLKPGAKVVKTGKQPGGQFLRVQPVGTKAIGFAHKSVVSCP